ncbi:uncharacterized protein LOC132628641 [Lycium barbarum]|uniref:uncharacterized protein LOC132628641 n=1 Tax=Lycium barbarum TaxID=112863 RepID=UPI00293E9213|nr:uncharacterized protein LOC132628641 [Lycium barbarum]
MGQTAGAQNTRPPGGLPSDTDPNPKLCAAVSLRKGRQLEELMSKKVIPAETATEDEIIEMERVAKTPVRLAKQKEEATYKKFLDLSKQVHVNVPLIDMLQGIPKYAKYIKDIVANKSRFTEYATVALTEECTSRIQNKFAYKVEGSRKLRLGNPRPTTIVLQLANRSLARPDDFFILEFEPDPEVPFILRHPFIATGRALIDIAAGQLSMRVHDKVEVFNVYKSLKLPAIYEEHSAITVMNDDTRRPLITSHDPLERALVGKDIFGDTEADVMM